MSALKFVSSLAAAVAAISESVRRRIVGETPNFFEGRSRRDFREREAEMRLLPIARGSLRRSRRIFGEREAEKRDGQLINPRALAKTIFFQNSFPDIYSAAVDQHQKEALRNAFSRLTVARNSGRQKCGSHFNIAR